MIATFRRILIRLGKVIPFILAFCVLIGHVENIYSVAVGRIMEDEYGFEYYYCPLSEFISHIVTIDFFDVFLLYILAVALELCWRNILSIHYLTLSLALRIALETIFMPEWVVILLCTLMALLGLICVYLGIKIIAIKK